MRLYAFASLVVVLIAPHADASLASWKAGLAACVAKPDKCAFCLYQQPPPAYCSTLPACDPPPPSCANCKQFPQIPGCSSLTLPEVCFTCFDDAGCNKVGCLTCYPRTVLPVCPPVASQTQPACYDIGLVG